MNIEIKNFLVNQETPEMIDLYEDVWNQLVEFNQTQFATVVDEMMMLASVGELESFIGEFRAYMHACMENVILEHGIIVSSEASARIKLELLRFFKQIEVTELVEPCLYLCDVDDENPRDLFCSIVEIVQGIDSIELIPHITEVSPSVIKAIHGYLKIRWENEETIEEIDSEELKTQYRDLLSYGTIKGARATVGFRLAFQEDGRVGDDFESLFTRNLDFFDRSSIQNFAKELVALALNSKSWRSPQIAIEELLPTITENLKEISELKQAVVHEIQTWSRAKG